MALDYYYDGQLRRYYMQFLRIFSGFKYANGTDSSGQPILRTVPAKLALQNRQVGHILRNNSENTLQATPQIACAQANIAVARDRTQNPSHVSKVQATEREVDSLTGRYGPGIGNSYTVERYMAVPYDLTMQVDIWTSNEMQKHQIMEQIMMLFNPSIDLQTGTNPLDWTALTIVEIQDITWSSRSIAIGVTDEIEVSTITFKMPIWISPPAKVKQQKIIQQIVTNIQAMEAAEGITECGNQESLYWSNSDMLSRIITTPGGHMVRVQGSEIILLGAHGATHDDTGKLYSWAELLEQYGNVRVGVSQLRLKTNPDMDDHDSDIVGVFEVHPLEPNKLLWVMDIASLPANTLGNIDGIVEAHRMWPGNGLPDAEEGQRYMLLDNVVGKSVAWGQLDADAGDIIQRVGDSWTVMFRGRDNRSTHYVLNARSGKQLKWDGTDWVLSVDGEYHAGFWRLFI